MFEDGAYLKIGCDKKTFSFYLTVDILSVQKSYSSLRTQVSFDCHHSPLPELFSGIFSQLRCHSVSFYSMGFDEKNFPALVLFKSFFVRGRLVIEKSFYKCCYHRLKLNLLVAS